MGNKSSTPTAEEQQNTIKLLLLGNPGTGKSSTGNSILQLETDLFKTSDGDRSVTKKCSAGYCDYQGQHIKVVDTPGLANNCRNNEESRTNILKTVEKAKTRDGYDAVLVVIQYGRQSREQSSAIDQLKEIIGNNVFLHHAILVVTRGDDFKRSKGKTQTFKEYCSKLTGQINELWKECDGRVVLFDNVTDNPEEMETQRRNLIDLVDQIKSTTNYTPVLIKKKQCCICAGFSRFFSWLCSIFKK